MRLRGPMGDPLNLNRIRAAGMLSSTAEEGMRFLEV